MAQAAMNPPRFIVPSVTPEQTELRLEGEVMRHLQVRRLRRGELVEVGNGQGLLRCGTISRVDATAAHITLRAGVAPRRDSPLDLTLIVPWLKGDALDQTVERISELGVRHLRLYGAERAIALPSPHRLHRLQRIAASAAQQCGRATLLQISTAESLAPILDARLPQDRLIIAAPGGAPINALATSAPLPCRVLAIIGPEGGFSQPEMAAAAAAGASQLGLGPRILRASTATMVAATLIQSLWGDLSTYASSGEEA